MLIDSVVYKDEWTVKRQFRHTFGLLRYRCFWVEYAERPHELPELDHAVPLEIEEVEHPVREEICSFAGPEEGELELFLTHARETQARSEIVAGKGRCHAMVERFYYLVDEPVFDDGEAELLVELVQRLHLVHRDCTHISHPKCTSLFRFR
jgi:hypothetical protein